VREAQVYNGSFLFSISVSLLTLWLLVPAERGHPSSRQSDPDKAYVCWAGAGWSPETSTLKADHISSQPHVCPCPFIFPVVHTVHTSKLFFVFFSVLTD
jgi:hypothetical protein